MTDAYKFLGVVQPTHFWMMIFGVVAVVLGTGLLIRAMTQTLRQERLFGILVMFLVIYPVPASVLVVLSIETIPKEYARAFGLAS